jgi:hypothetical protein
MCVAAAAETDQRNPFMRNRASALQLQGGKNEAEDMSA